MRSLYQLQPRVVACEVLSLVGLRVRNIGPDLPEPVGVELPDKGGPAVVSVRLRDDLVREAAGVENDEGQSILRPAPYLRGTARDDGVRLSRVSFLGF